MESPDVIIFGATHIGIRLAMKLAAKFSRVLVIDRNPVPPQEPLGWLYESGDFTIPASLDGVQIIYAVTEEDSLNIRIALAVRNASQTMPIIITLVQSRLGKKLARHLDNFQYVCPPELAAKKVVDAIYAPSTAPAQKTSPLIGDEEAPLKAPFRIDPLILYAISASALMATLSTVYFRYSENLAWLDAFYFVVTLMATVGFGDISLRDSTPIAKLIGIMLMIASVTNTAVIFALITDSLLKHRLTLSFGRRRIKDSDHIIVVGAGSVGFKVIEELIKYGESVVVVESDPHGKYMPTIYARRVRAIIGDAMFESTLRDASLPQAKALLSMTSDDLTNLEIALNSKAIAPDVRVILRIYDQTLAQSLDQRLDIHFTMSMSMTAAVALAQYADDLIGETENPSKTLTA
jgi:Trk K+ transport system NAD-binding subunit